VCGKAPGTHASSGAADSPPTHGDEQRFPLAFVTKLVKVSRAFASADTINVLAKASPL
jgi:hypothetical protein